MRQPRIIAIGDAVCDKYLSRGKCIQEVSVLTHVHMRI